MEHPTTSSAALQPWERRRACVLACGSRTPTLTGAEIRALMRQHRQTIRGIAARWNITLRRVREVRTNGVTGFLASEWFYMLTGRWPGTIAGTE